MPQPDLDSPAIYESLDPEGIYGRIAALPDQVRQAWDAAADLPLPSGYADATAVVIAGVGGSGIGGGLMRALAVSLGARIPVHTVRGYVLPAFVDGRALVIGSSNSGNTEETCAAFEVAIERGASCMAIATGGRLAAIARGAGVPLLAFDWDGEQRSALGWSFAAPLSIAVSLGLVPKVDLPSALDEMRDTIGGIARDVPESSNTAKRLARRLAGRLPVIVGAEAFAPVAYRWRTQVNENAKSWAIADELPEMNHNAHAGYGLPAESVALMHALLLRHEAVHPRTARRFDATQAKMREQGVSAEIIDITGHDVFAQMLRGLAMGDLVSYYLGLLNGVHPSPVPALLELKDWMSKEA